MRAATVLLGLTWFAAWCAVSEATLADDDYCEGPAVYTGSYNGICEDSVYSLEEAKVECKAKNCLVLHNVNCDSEFTWRICPGAKAADLVAASAGQDAAGCTLASVNDPAGCGGATTTEAGGEATSDAPEERNASLVVAPTLTLVLTGSFQVTVASGVQEFGAANNTEVDIVLQKAIATVADVPTLNVSVTRKLVARALSGRDWRLRRLTGGAVNVEFGIAHDGLVTPLANTMTASMAELDSAIDQELQSAGLPQYGDAQVSNINADTAHVWGIMLDNDFWSCNQSYQIILFVGQEGICRATCDSDSSCTHYYYDSASLCRTYSSCNEVVWTGKLATTYEKVSLHRENDWLIAGPCFLNESCMYSPNFPSNYENDQSCYMESPTGRKVETRNMSTEKYFDFLAINGETYHGEENFSGILPSTPIYWSSDYSEAAIGWILCLMDPETTTLPDIVETTGADEPAMATEESDDLNAVWIALVAIGVIMFLLLLALLFVWLRRRCRKRRDQPFKEEAPLVPKFQVADRVEGKRGDGQWYKAIVKEIHMDKPPLSYTVDWDDGFADERVHGEGELRYYEEQAIQESPRQEPPVLEIEEIRQEPQEPPPVASKVTVITGWIGEYVDRVVFTFMTGQSRLWEGGSEEDQTEKSFIVTESEVLTGVEQVAGESLGAGLIFYTSSGRKFELLGKAGAHGVFFLDRVIHRHDRINAPAGTMMVGLRFHGSQLSGISTVPIQDMEKPTPQPIEVALQAHRPKVNRPAFSVNPLRSGAGADGNYLAFDGNVNKAKISHHAPPAPSPYKELAPVQTGLAGRWMYSSHPSDEEPLSLLYTIKDVDGASGQYLFGETHPDKHIVLGTLSTDGEWVAGTLHKDSNLYGFIRIRLNGPNHTITNFRYTENDPWGNDHVGTRQPDSSANSGRSSRSSSNKINKQFPHTRSWEKKDVERQGVVPRLDMTLEVDRGKLAASKVPLGRLTSLSSNSSSSGRWLGMNSLPEAPSGVVSRDSD